LTYNKKEEAYSSLTTLASLNYVFFDQAYPQLKQQIKQNSGLYEIQSALIQEYELNIKKLHDQPKSKLSVQTYISAQNKLRILDRLLRLLFTHEKEEEKIKKLCKAVQNEQEMLRGGNILKNGLFGMFAKRKWSVLEDTCEKLRELTLLMSRKPSKTMTITNQENL